MRMDFEQVFPDFVGSKGVRLNTEPLFDTLATHALFEIFDTIDKKVVAGRDPQVLPVTPGHCLALGGFPWF